MLHFKFLVLPHNVTDILSKVSIYTLVTNQRWIPIGDSTDFLILYIHHFLFHINIQRSKKQYWKLIRKLTGILLAPFINKTRNTSLMAMSHSYLLDTRQVRMIIYHDWLSSGSCSFNIAMSPFTIHLSESNCISF